MESRTKVQRKAFETGRELNDILVPGRLQGPVRYQKGKRDSA